MKTTKLILFLIACFLLFGNALCDFDHDEYNCYPKQLETSLSIDLAQEKIEYNIGDTIWINKQLDFITILPNGIDTMFLENAIGGFNMEIMKFIGSKFDNRGYNDFKIINTAGELNQSDITDTIKLQYTGKVNFDCTKDNCEFKIGLIPINKGNYVFHLNYGYLRKQDFPTM